MLQTIKSKEFGWTCVNMAVGVFPVGWQLWQPQVRQQTSIVWEGVSMATKFNSVMDTMCCTSASLTYTEMSEVLLVYFWQFARVCNTAIDLFKMCIDVSFNYKLDFESLKGNSGEPESKFWLKFFYDNGGSAKKKRETAGISYKNNGGYRRFLEI